MMLATILSQLETTLPLNEEQACVLLSSILQGELETPVIAHVLSRLHERGVSVDELVGGARAMRSKATLVPLDDALRARCVDTCGTGGGPKAFNISTLAAIVAAAAADGQVLVAKHGNKSKTGRGSAEILMALGVKVDAPPAVQAECLEQAHVCFCFAVQHHAAVKHAREARAMLPFPTIFNALGPLTNPALAPRQVMGVYDAQLASKLAAALARLGSQQAMTLHATNGMDELSLASDTLAWHVRSHDDSGQDSAKPEPATTITTAAMQRAGVALSDVASVQARDLEHAAAIARDVLDARAGAPLEWTVASAGLTLAIALAPPSCTIDRLLHDFLPRGIGAARNALMHGDARRTLEKLAKVSTGA